MYNYVQAKVMELGFQATGVGMYHLPTVILPVLMDVPYVLGKSRIMLCISEGHGTRLPGGVA